MVNCIYILSPYHLTHTDESEWTKWAEKSRQIISAWCGIKRAKVKHLVIPFTWTLKIDQIYQEF